MKKIISLILVIIVITVSTPVQFAASYFTNEADFKAYLDSNGIYTNTKGENANFNTYITYDYQIVYGKPYGDPATPQSGKFKGIEQRRYLGHSLSGADVTNSYFPEDALATGSNPTKWTYENTDPSSGTWATLNPAQRNHMLDASLSYSGTEYPSVTVNSIGGTTKAKVLTRPGWKAGFSVYTQHFSGGKLWYATLYGDSMARSADLTCAVSTSQNTYRILAGQDSVTVPVTVKGTLSLSGSNVNYSQVKSFKASFENSTSPDASGTSNVSFTANKILSRSAYGAGTHQVTLKGSTTVKSVFSDDSPINASGSKNITLIVDEDKTPYVTVTASCNPASKQFDNTDIPVTVNVSGALNGYANPANIDKVVVFARKAEDTAAQSVTLPAGLSGSASFHFVIPKSAVTGDTHTQEFRTTVRFHYKAAVNGSATIEGSSACLSYIYKTPDEPDLPPQGNNKPPVPVIDAPEEVRQGEYFDFSGSGSYDEDGYITDYILGSAGANLVDEGESYRTIWYSSLGNKKLHLAVIDNDGARKATTQMVKVIPPEVHAAINYTGALKENRKVTLINASRTPEMYPLNPSKTVWTISAISGGATTDIKYTGSLTGVDTKDVLFKKAGQYQVTITVQNSAGYTDTATRLLTIAPDLPPVANFFTINTVLRNYDDYNHATIDLRDQSYSPDGDIIGSRTWKAAYDSDNDGSFSDETFTIIDAGNNPNIIYKATEVGKYKFELYVQEDFGQPTISSFVTDSDYKRDDTLDKPDGEKIVEVINAAPVVDFTLTKKPMVDIQFLVEKDRETDLQNNLAVFQSRLAASNIDFNIKVDTVSNEGTLTPTFYRSMTGSAYKEDGDPELFVNNRAINIIPNSAAGTTTFKVEDYAGAVCKTFTVNAVITYYSSYTFNNKKGNELYLLNTNTSTGYLTLYCVDIDSGTLKYINAQYVGEYVSNNFSLGNVYMASDGNIDCTVMSLNGSYYYAKNYVFSPVSGTVIYSHRYPYTFNYSSSSYTLMSGSTDLGVLIGVSRTMGQVYTVAHKSDGTKAKDGSKNINQIDFRIFDMYGNLVSTDTGKNTDGYEACSKSLSYFYDDMVYYVTETRSLSKQAPPGTGYTVSESFSLRGYNAKTGTFCSARLKNGSFERRVVGDSAYIMVGSQSGYNFVFDDPYTLKEKFTIPTNGTKSASLYYAGYVDDYLLAGYSESRSSTPDYYIATFKNGVLQSKVSVTSSDLGGARNKEWGYMMSIGANNSEAIKTVFLARSAVLNKKLAENTFRQDAVKYVVPMLDKNLYSAGAWDDSRLIAQKGANVIFLAGPDSNLQEYKNNLFSSTQGLYHDLSSSMATNLNTVADDILSNAKPSIVTQYVLLNEEITSSQFYSDYEHDPMYQGRWKFIHSDPDYFDNGLGIMANSGAYITDPIVKFDKVGKIDVSYQARDNPKDDVRFDGYRLWSKEAQMTLYAHRKPIAQFSLGAALSAGGYTPAISDTSYDPDHTGRVDKGIAARQWSYKLADSSVWINGQPAVFDSGKIYMVQLMVQDVEGAWSDPAVKTFDTNNPDLPPVVQADPSSRTWTNKDVSVTVTASDPNGDYSHTNYCWSVSTDKPAAGWSVGTAASFVTAQSNTGVWYLHLEAFDNAGNSYYTAAGPYQIDKLPPVIDCAPASYSGSGPVDIGISSSDTGGSGVKEIWYMFANSTAKPSSGWSVVSSGSASATLEADGIWYLHMQVFDNAGNSYYRYRGVYEVRHLKITDVSVAGYWNHWRGQVNAFGEQMSVEPHRFLSLECVKIDIKTQGDPDKVVIRFSPELEAMTYTDPKGNVYDYSTDFFHYYVDFPQDSTFIPVNNSVTWEYNLPLAPSTKDWDDLRKKPQFKMTVTAWKGSASVTYTVDDIDITGNIYDLTYIQPVR